MKKTLILYWYIHPQGWHELYDLHLKCLDVYKGVFDKEKCIFSYDPDTKPEYVDNAKKKMRDIFPDAEFVDYKNDKQFRESRYFYDEIIMKLNQMPDEWFFFAHFKGVDSFYVTKANLYKWIAGMYYMNLSDIPAIEKSMEEPDVCAIGTYLIRNIKCWPFLKYSWHFSGTFFWFNPQRVYKIMNQYHNAIPACNKMISEGFFGSVIPDDERYRVPALMRYDADRDKGFKWMSDEMKKDFISKFKN